jgi:hypothetical protein
MLWQRQPAYPPLPPWQGWKPDQGLASPRDDVACGTFSKAREGEGVVVGMCALVCTVQ